MRTLGSYKPFFAVFSVAFLLGSCVTVNIYFPAAAIEKAADRIVEETWGSGQGEDETSPADDPGPGSFRGVERTFLALTVGPPPAAAQGVDINVTTPAIRALKEAIRQRAATLKPFLDRGAVAIAGDGLLQVRSAEGLNMKEKAKVARLVEKENSDREALYREIAAANSFGADRVPDIKGIFARSWIKNAEPGWWVQNQQGGWIRKAP